MDELTIIGLAPRSEDGAALAARVGCSRSTVSIHRAAVRRENIEIARAQRAAHIAMNHGDSLAALARMRRNLEADYMSDRTPARGRAVLEAIRIELAELAPDPSTLTEEECMGEVIAAMARLAGITREWQAYGIEAEDLTSEGQILPAPSAAPALDGDADER